MSRLADLAADARARLAGLPGWAKAAMALGALYGVGRMTGQIGRVTLDPKPIQHLPRYKRGRAADRERRLQVTRWLLDELQREGTMTLDEIAVFLDIGYWESGMEPRAVSARGMPDDAVGRSWGVLQLAATTIQWLGFAIEDVSPRRGPDGSIPPTELERATRQSARLAVAACTRPRPDWADGRTWLEAVRALHRDDVLGAAREFMVRWQAGQGRTWADIARVRPNRRIGSLGWLHYSVPKRIETLPRFRAAIGLPPHERELHAWVETTPWARAA